MTPSFALTQNVNNFMHKGCMTPCLRNGYERCGLPYLAGLMTGLASFLRMQGHDKDEVKAGIELALAEITDGTVTEPQVLACFNG